MALPVQQLRQRDASRRLLFEQVFQASITCIDRILKGTPPGELPIRPISDYVFVINLNAAQAIGLTMPEAVLTRATEIIR